ncbi:MAG: DUF3604 domain-containing protein [Chloroflexi bacterium]|nr:DUF3604 domain-containing protein [Chloroflexota bacterium]
MQHLRLLRARCGRAVGNTVDVENATWTSTIGANELIAVWEAPDFDSGQSAFSNYARAIEIPSLAILLT